MKKNIRYIVAVIIMCILVVGVYLYRKDTLDKDASNDETLDLENSIQQDDIDEGEGEENEEGMKIYPKGKLENLEKLYDWIEAPEADEYDPDNKIAINCYYGRTVDEAYFQDDLEKELMNYDKDNVLSEELSGQGIYNPDNVYAIGDEFELKPENIKGKITKSDKNVLIEDLESEYFVNGKEKVNANMEKEGMCLISADISLESSAEWVKETEITPVLIYLENKGEYYRQIDWETVYGEDAENYSQYPEYYDLGFYQLNTNDTEINCFLYPMRKEETVSFKVGYLVPDEYLDNAYLYYRFYGSDDIDNSFNNEFDVLIKLS
jgi:hypothetical protein